VRRHRLASGWRPTPIEKFRYRKGRERACGGQCDSGKVLTQSLRKQQENQVGRIRLLFRVTDLVVHWDYFLEWKYPTWI